MKIKTLLLLLIGLTSINSRSQTINCNSFCVTDIQLSTTPGDMVVTIFMGGSSGDFISYPYVLYVLNSTGDTIANHGSISSFGTFGNQSSTYDLPTTLSSIPANLNCTVFFRYYKTGGEDT